MFLERCFITNFRNFDNFGKVIEYFLLQVLVLLSTHCHLDMTSGK